MTTPVRIALALSGWAALLATALPDASPVRVAALAAFVLCCPGAAAVRPPSPRGGDPSQVLEGGVLTVAVSLALAVLVSEAFFLSHTFSAVRAVGTLAFLTSVLALWPRRRTGDAARPGPEAGGAGPRPKGAPRAWRKAALRAPAAVLLALTAACGSGSGRAVDPGNSGASGGGTAPATGSSSAPASTPADASGTSGPAAPGPWRLAFQDDFNGSALDTARWATCYDWNVQGCTNGGNHESEWYLPGQVSVGGGLATLSAVRRDTQGSDGKTYPWTSGMITTGRDSWDAKPRETFVHGYFEAALQVPASGGMFPAFWLIPVTRVAPPELDVAEFTSPAQNVDMNVHWPGADGSDQHAGQAYGPVDFPAGLHVFALDWEQNSLTWYVDGVERWRQTDPVRIPNVPMELILNLAVGWPSPPPASVDSAAMKVDWVRVWQH